MFTEYTNKTGACQPQTPIPEEASVLLFGNNDSMDVPNCQPTPEEFFNSFANSFLGEDNEDGLPEGPAEKPKYECMSVWYTETNPQTGQRMKYPWYCHDFRNCYVCHTKRRTDFQSQLINALRP